MNNRRKRPEQEEKEGKSKGEVQHMRKTQYFLFINP